MLVLKFIEFCSLLFQLYSHIYIYSLPQYITSGWRFFWFVDLLHRRARHIIFHCTAMQCKTLICIFIKTRQTFNSVQSQLCEHATACDMLFDIHTYKFPTKISKDFSSAFFSFVDELLRKYYFNSGEFRFFFFVFFSFLYLTAPIFIRK